MLKLRWYRIKACLIRQFWILRRTPERLFDLLFWAVMLDVVLLGFMSRWMSRNDPNAELEFQAFMCCLVAWRMVWTGCYEFAMGFLDECWNRSLANIIVSPLTWIEWFLAAIIGTFCRSFISLGACVLAVKIFFDIQVIWFNSTYIITLLGLFIFGISLGCIGLSVVLKFGIRAQFIVWSLTWIAAPLSGVFFPLEALPSWLAKVVYILPSSFLIGSIRTFASDQDIVAPISFVFTGVTMSLLYLILFGAVSVIMFQRTRLRGFDHLE